MSTANQKVLARVGHMLEAIRHANSDIDGMSIEQFLADGKSQRAVNDSIIVIGEAAKRIMQAAPSCNTTMPSSGSNCKTPTTCATCSRTNTSEWTRRLSGQPSRTTCRSCATT